MGTSTLTRNPYEYLAARARVIVCTPDDFDSHVVGTHTHDQTPIFGSCGGNCQAQASVPA